MPTANPPLSIARARRLRQDMTDAERHLCYVLRRRNLNGWRFRRQAPIGIHIVDFACFGAKLIIELDGGQHAEDRRAYDERRTDWLKSQGFSVPRFWSADVFQSTEYVVEEILRVLPAAPLPNPPPQGGRGNDEEERGL